jgi:D-alanyl-D-alanine carboxypeptidase/D-alanyl-D-alanine-endopeptidase (penicillin-binding protein 4)
MSPRPVSLTGLLLAAGLLAARSVPAQDAGASWEALQVQAEAMLDPIERETAIDLGFRVERLDGTLLIDHQGERRLALASNLKLFTSAAALFALGPDYRWSTRVELEGGRLQVIGGGDPSLRSLPDGDATSDFLDAVAAALQARGKTRLEALVVDGRAFAVEGPHPLWPQDQLQAEYAAPIAALAVEGGLLEVAWAGTRARLRPAVGEALELRVLDGRAASLSAWWGKDREIRVRRPSSGKAQEVRFAQRDPLAIAGWSFADGLRRRGIRVDAVEIRRPGAAAVRQPPEGQPVEAGAASAAELLLDWPSRWTLADAVMVCNKDSDNFVAETLLLTLGMEREGVGSWENGARVAREVLSENGLEDSVVDLADGSGLARAWPRLVDASTAAETCALLRRMAVADAAGRVFFDSLPIGGVDGSLAARFREAGFQPQRVHAKTGFILGASSLSGYLLVGEDQVLVFSFLVNFDRARNKDTNNRRFRELRKDLLAMVMEGGA